MTTRNQKLTEKALKEMVEGNSLAEEEIVPTNEEDDKIPKLREKITELEEIFEAVNNEIEWEKREDTSRSRNYTEQNEILQEYTTLNNDFQKRLDENYMTDEREIGEKRPILESPCAENSKRKEEKTEKKKKKKDQ
ncbi:hypothetical protein RhiirA5_419374 [Rhizophagus irregularis]|uniref:Uncharacterized protein n=2 Tax=Rhizophagus irregularis TaxID=588596 RepID=A0A2N0PID3_9GLOM|nr:hypothetical protein GLOIN_2v1791892 [Rhizophagus irregularis DAOM 181602=DAOM 197198]PKC06584.1 hypothetical protein RhiirA5_419374 [Rhizophagus irregularis]POG56294.1 hypothetical protein GLOIN_2v1791892 [Rhizophagus irregularis DAOM 181602=DAOM 197198]|eukprot:XP_025164321.1 hypothetical protein GLOIN_2v1791892 [Rhizophagus irregularis DAOM 181602=DAOM 197198]